jgi:small subunit ribosomal protein S20
MPVTRGAIKKQRQDKKRKIVNTQLKKRVKNAIKEFKRSPSKKNLSVVYSLLDTAKKKNLFHKNKTSRLKSRLSKLLVNKKTLKKSVSSKKTTRTKKSK